MLGNTKNKESSQENRFALLKPLSHAERRLFLELSRRSAITHSTEIRATLYGLSKACFISTKSVQNAIDGLVFHKMIEVQSTRPKTFRLLYDFDLHLRLSESKIVYK